MLERLLTKIPDLSSNSSFSYSVVVVDNDQSESAKDVVARAKTWAKFPIDYHLEPERSISLARNRSVRNAKGDLIAFIDDDEFPSRNWLSSHFKALLATGADGVLGPVEPYFDVKGPDWLTKSGLLERRRLKTGEVISNYGLTRTGNVLLWKRLFDMEGGYFEPKYGRIGGGDAVFFKNMMEKGKVFIWCDEACVYEIVPPERQVRWYYLKRAFTRGLTESWEKPFFSVATLRSVVAVLAYSCALPFLLLIGPHFFMKYLVKDCDHASKLLAYLGIKLASERPYQSISARSVDGQARR